MRIMVLSCAILIIRSITDEFSTIMIIFSAYLVFKMNTIDAVNHIMKCKRQTQQYSFDFSFTCSYQIFSHSC